MNTESRRNRVTGPSATEKKRARWTEAGDKPCRTCGKLTPHWITGTDPPVVVSCKVCHTPSQDAELTREAERRMWEREEEGIAS